MQRRPPTETGAARGRANLQPAVQFDLDEENDNLDKAGATGAVILPPLAPGVKFNITSTMIQLLNLKWVFWRTSRR